MTPASFAEEEELRELLQERGHVHDCVEAGCTLNPDGKAIPEESEGQKRPPIPDHVNELYRKIHGEDHPEWTEEP